VATFKNQGSDTVIVQWSCLKLFNRRAIQKGSSYSDFINNVFCNWLETFGWQLFFQYVVEQISNRTRFHHWNYAVHQGC